MGYGPRFTQVFRQRARLVARVLRGVKLDAAKNFAKAQNIDRLLRE